MASPYHWRITTEHINTSMGRMLVAELVLGHGIRVVDLVAEDDERHLGELLHRQERVELGLGLGEPLVVLGVDEEDDAVDFGEVVFPEAAGCGGITRG